MPVWLIATILSLGVGFLAWIDSGIVRYGFVGVARECSVRQVIKLPSDAEVIAIGSSRVLRGIDPDIVIAASHQHFGNFYNLGRGWLDPARNYVMFRDILERGARPKYAFVEFNLDALSRAGDKTSNFSGKRIGFLTYADLPSIYDALSDRPLSAFYATLNGLFSKINYAIVLHLTGDVPAAIWHLSEPVDSICQLEGFDRPSPKKEREKAAYLKSLQEKFHDLAHDEDDFELRLSDAAKVELYYLQKIRELAQAHNITLVVSRHWKYSQPPLSDAAVARVKAVVPEFIYPPKDFVRAASKDFADDLHMGPSARRMFSEWLAGELLRREL